MLGNMRFIVFTLTLGAITFTGCVAYLGFNFSLAVEEPNTSIVTTLVFWLCVGGLTASPFWMPIALLNRSSVIAGVFRLGCLLGLAAIASICGYQLVFDISRSQGGQQVGVAEFGLDSFLTMISVVCIMLVYKMDRLARASGR